ncbi:hypothetical protein [Streptomyces sp. NPDC008150]|uniref:hypothetical protein n=1 Tax=Streptomyces sp. NPDC008150 TaxID=3364816 RepID=UPI0036EBA25B
MYPEHASHGPVSRAVDVHTPVPLPPAVAMSAPVAAVQPGTVPAVASIVLPNGQVVTGYAMSPVQPEPLTVKPAVSRTAVNVMAGGVGFLAVCGGLFLLTAFITALTALITQLIVFAAVCFGGFVAVQVCRTGGHRGGTTVNIRKAVIKRNKFYG